MKTKHFFMNARDLRKELEKYARIERVWDNEDYSKSVKKAASMSTDSMLTWMDDAILGMGKGIMDYRRTGDLDSIYEIRKAVSILQALTEELIIKQENS